MKIAFASFESAIRAHVSPALASSLAGAAQALFGVTSPPERIDDRSSGELILRAALQLPDWSRPQLELECLDVPTTTPRLILGPSDVAEHSLFGPQTPTDFSEAVTAAFVRGVRRLDLNPQAPVIGALSVSSFEGGYSACAHLVFQTAHAFARYGPFVEQQPFTRMLQFSGAALMAAGDASREAPQVEPREVSGAACFVGSGALN